MVTLVYSFFEKKNLWSVHYHPLFTNDVLFFFVHCILKQISFFTIAFIQLNHSITGTKNPGVIGDRRSMSRESK
jgi:hypothetical protein